MGPGNVDPMKPDPIATFILDPPDLGSTTAADRDVFLEN
jgi:hypothetical protein